MAYIITKTNGGSLVTVPDTEKNTEYGVTLVGRNYSGYGVYLNDNFVSLMENFANNTAPGRPLDGQLWFNTTTATLSLWNGNAWRALGVLTNSSSAPSTSGTSIGHMWWDNSNYQLKVWSGQTEYARTATQTITLGNIVSVTSTGSVSAGDYVTHANISALDRIVVEQVLYTTQVRISTFANISNGETVMFTNGIGWQTVGPVYTKDQNLNGVIPGDVIDTNGIPHVIALMYNDGQIVGTISRDVEYTPRTADAIAGFTTIKPGLQLKSSVSRQFTKTVQATAVGSAGSTTFVVGSNGDLAIGDYFISGNVQLGTYTQLDAIYANGAVTVGTTTTVYENETVTFQRGTVPVLVFNGIANDSQLFNGRSPDGFAQTDLTTTFHADFTINGNTYLNGGNIAVTTTDRGNVTVRNTIYNANVSFTANVPGVGVNAQLLNLSGNDGLVTVRAEPTAALGVATKSYVDTRDNNTRDMLTTNVAALIGTAPAGFQDLGLASANVGAITTTLAATQADVALKAYAADAALTGTPTAPTATAGTDTTQIATTAFTTSAVATLNNTVTANLALKAPSANPTFTGVPIAPTASSGTANTQIATTAFVTTTVNTAINAVDLAPYATKVSPVITGVPIAPTPAASVNNTQLATTAFVHSVIPAGIIMLWSGSSEFIPAGWALCNGSSGTPDLRDRFVVGAGPTFSALTSGGSKDLIIPSHTHSASASSTFNGAAFAAHTHTFTGSALASHGHTFTGTALPNHSHTFTGSPFGTEHTHTVNDPGHKHWVSSMATDDRNITGTGANNQQYGLTADAGSYSADDVNKNTGRNTLDKLTGVSVNPASVGTPTGTNSGTSAGTPSGTNSAASAGTPSGTNSSESVGTPSGTVATAVTVASTGVSGTNANLPPYYALCYIMKTYG
jgi:hypothetical protein